jgi:hypothetical protein
VQVPPKLDSPPSLQRACQHAQPGVSEHGSWAVLGLPSAALRQLSSLRVFGRLSRRSSLHALLTSSPHWAVRPQGVSRVCGG